MPDNGSPGDREPGGEPLGAENPGAENLSGENPGGEQPGDSPSGAARLPRRPGVSLIDAGLGAGCLASRAAMAPMRAIARTGRRLAPPARRALAAPAARGLTDWSCWMVRTLAQVGAPQRARAERRVRILMRGTTRAAAADRDIGWMVRDLASRQLAALIDEALPIVLARLAERPDEVRRIVRGQSHGIAAEARQTARQGARRGDDAVDAVVGRLLRRRATAADPPSEPEGRAQ